MANTTTKTTTKSRKPALRNGPCIPPPPAPDRILRGGTARHGRLPYYEPLRNLKAKEIEDVLRVEANKGLFARPAWTFHEMAKVCSLVEDKVNFWKAQIAAMDWRIEVAADAQGDDADPARARRADAQRAVLQRRYEGFRNLKTALEHLATARFYGFAVLRAGERMLDPVKPWNVIHDVQWLTEAEPTYGWFFNKRAESQLWRARMPLMENAGGGWIIRETDDDGSMLALMRLGLRAMRIMDFREKDLEAASRRQVVVLTGGNLPDDGEEKEKLLNALTAARDGESSVFAKGDPECPTEVVFAPASRGLMYYNEALEQIDQWMTKAVTGGMLTMLAMPTGIGSGASAQHAETLNALIANEAAGIMETLWRDVDEPALRDAGLLGDGERPLAWFKLAGKEQKDPAAAAAVLVQLKQAGKQVDDGTAGEMLGFEVTAAPEPDPAAAAGGMGGGGGFGDFVNDAKAFAAALRNRSGEYLERKRAVRLDGKFFDFLENLANKYGGKAEADEEWLDKIAGMIEDAPPETFVDSAALEAWLEAKMRRGEREALDNRQGEKCPDCGQWLDENGFCHECHKADELADKGENPDDAKMQAAEIGKGKAAIKKCLEQKVDVPDAVTRSDVGTISILYGSPVDTPEGKAWGLSHFAQRQDTLEHLPDTLVRGTAQKPYQDGQKRNIVLGKYTAVLALSNDPKKEARPQRWVLTAFQPSDQKQNGGHR